MENVRVVKIILPILAIFFISVPIKAYGPNTTHHGLTAEIIKFFEYSYSDKKFSEEEKNWLKNGSVDEDHDIRPMNHFYDPVYNRGLWGFVSSKEWSQDTLAQARRDAGFLASAGNVTRGLFSSPADYSWDRAIYEYVYGDKKKAMESLGHNLHLIEDATVPDHTRNDPHPPYFDDVFSQASPYEGWTEQFNESNITAASDLIKTGMTPVYYSSLNEYFDRLANFSNANFFSKDTVPNINGVYSDPTIQSEKTEIWNGKYLTFGYKSGYRLSLVTKIRSGETNTLITEYYVKDPENLVVSDYWSILSKEAVKNGAGVIKLFFDEVEKEKRTMALYEKNKSSLTRAKEKIISALGLAGQNTAATQSAIGSLAADAIQNTDETESTESDAALVPFGDDSNESENDGQTPILAQSDESEDEPSVKPQTPNQNIPTNPKTNQKQPSAPTPSATPAPGFGGGQPSFGGGAGGGAQGESAGETPSAPEPVRISVTSPSDFSQNFTTSSITFSGTSTPNAIVSNSYSSATTTSDGGGDWQLSVDFEEGTNAISFTAAFGGETATTQNFGVFVDSIAPELSLEIPECGNSISAGCVLMGESEINLRWTSEDSSITEFTVNLNGDTETTSATSTSFSLEEDETYEFSVKAADSSGNETTVSKIVEKISRPVVINEIAWAGTAANSSHEWLELYNRFDKTVNLNGWTLSVADGAPNIALSGSVAPLSYYLLERGNDNTIFDIAADLVYGNFGSAFALSNNGEEMLLKRGDYVVDKTPPINDTEGCGFNKWCAGQNITGGDIKRNSMERLDYDVAGDDKENWGTAIGEFVLNGKDASGYDVLGTPKSGNSASRLITESGILNYEKTLTKKFSPYIVGRTGFTINFGGILNVEPGIVIKIVKPNEPNFTVNAGGKLVVSGSDSEKIIFTSFGDDEYGPEIGDGQCSEAAPERCPAPGDWGRIIANSGATLDIKNAIVRYGGRWFSGSPDSRKSMISAEGAAVNLDSVLVENSKKHGLYIKDAIDAIITNGVFKNMNVDLDAVALYADNSSITITSPQFENNSVDVESVLGASIVCDDCSDLVTIPADLF